MAKFKIIEDLHGNIFKRDISEFNISPADPYNAPTVIHKGEIRILTRDLKSQESFILIKYQDQFGYIFQKNDVFIYGLLEYAGYKPENDIRHKDIKI